jgi:iron complex outermembrane receptor protein
MLKKLRSQVAFMASAILLSGLTPATAQTSAGSEPLKLDALTVTGTRRLDRTVVESMVPVDIVGTEALQTSVSAELTDKLVQAVPSFNVQRLTIGEGAAFVRPARLRGLSPDQTLVLINGKRQHRSALITGGFSQGADLGQIPAFGLQRVEVLRDGASAQYGSDAIAGVINLILKDRVGYEGFAQVSQYFGGDGFNRQAGFDAGYALPAGGFLNVALEYAKAGRTSRSVQRADALAYIAAHPERAADVPKPVQRWGQPERESRRFMLNAALPLTPAIKTYAFIVAGDGEGLDDFNWRNPDTNAAFRRSSFQNAPTSIAPTYSLLSRYPGGFAPFFASADDDFHAVGGAKGITTFGLTYDFSAALGRNRIDYRLTNSINASFGPESPTAFDVGGLRQDERNLNADFVYNWQTGLFAKPVNVAFGAENRRERFKIRVGDRYSWDVGPFADLAVGANGFPGWSPSQVVDADRDSNAGYLDLDIQPLKDLSFGLSGRAEDYSDFGSTADGKISFRYQTTPTLALRGAASTGFHAPTPGLSYYTRTNQGLLPGTSTLFTSGQISVTNPVAVFFGARALKPEESDNLSLGVVFAPRPGFTVAVDLYRVAVRDRLGLSQGFTLTAAQRAQLVASGVTDAQNLNSLNFLTNAFDTRTEGVDVVASQRWTRSKQENITLTAAYNYNATRVTRYDPRVVSRDGRINLENRIPQNAGNVAVNYALGSLGLMGRVRYFGEWTDAQANSTIVQDFSRQVLCDVAVSWKFTREVSATAGVENVFNRYPDKATFNAANGLLYSRNAPYDADGGRWYLRVNASF